MVGGLFLWPALRCGTGYQTVWEIRPSAETHSIVHWRRFYFQLTCIHSAIELSGRCALQIYLLTFSKEDSHGPRERESRALRCWQNEGHERSRASDHARRARCVPSDEASLARRPLDQGPRRPRSRRWTMAVVDGAVGGWRRRLCRGSRVGAVTVCHECTPTDRLAGRLFVIASLYIHPHAIDIWCNVL